MSFWKLLLSTLKGWYSTTPTKNTSLPPRIYNNCEFVRAPPSNAEIQNGQFFVVIPANEPKWALFKCPCNCGQVITLSLALNRTPRWNVTMEENQYPTLWPSVRQLKGCLSHFWMRDGRIHWCDDTGRPYDLKD